MKAALEHVLATKAAMAVAALTIAALVAAALIVELAQILPSGAYILPPD